MIRRPVLVTSMLALAALAACGDDTPNPTAKTEAVATRTVGYRCADGTTLSAGFTGDALVLADGGNTITLQRAISGSGARYTNPYGAEFWDKGGQATYSRIAGAASTTCTAG
ncbi:MliC family protein [Inquilinus limosus]|uniref:MliC family protein n=1 Tax=Inquilinus limosus TaxID=171674 RepID=UPI0003F4EA07|nr:MliC family protein [Inquilinus limosus]